MKNEIIILADYKGNFGSKWNAIPYRSGMDIEKIKEGFSKIGFNTRVFTFAEIMNADIDLFANSLVVYTSTEDIGYYYKDFIEDVVLGLETLGAITIPQYKYLRATNNKVLMEILRKLEFKGINTLKSKVYGSYVELKKDFDSLKFPLVLKEAAGAMSEGVFLVNNLKDLKRKVKQLSRTSNFLLDIKDYLRPYKHQGYILESRNRKKFIIQDFIPNLVNDWKILVFGDKYFIFSRPVRKNDFRASGSGSVNYLFGSKCIYPDGIFDFAKSVYEEMETPHLSIDIAYDGNSFFIIEFQAIFFGTVGVVKSDVYFKKDDNGWVPHNNSLEIEDIYVDSVNHYLKLNS